jgi:hypothetical protein
MALVVGNVRVSEGRETVKQRNGGEDDFEPPWQRHSHNGDSFLAPSLQRDFHFTFGLAQHRP